ncbi:hypothetical protein G6F56_005021 [Rhizopus delemar]|nr:hypothetical protein G6F56_005021 [Rhizopus delemar]
MILKARGVSPPLHVIINSPETDAGVVIDNELYLLTPSKKSEIVLQTKAPGGRRYFYAKLKKNTTEIVDQEPFLRNPVTQRWTFNEFYGRNWNAKQVVNFQPVSEIANNFNREDDFDLHPVGEIATIHVIAPQADITKMHDRFLDDLDIRVDITHISATSVKQFTNCTFGITGRTSRYFNKLPYKMKIPKDGLTLSGYRNFKLRALDNDPSYMREYLTTDIIQAMNQPATRASYVRLFFNNQAIGLFVLVEKYDATWLEKQFNRDHERPYLNGIMYEGHGGKSNEDRADLSFKGNDISIYDSSSYGIAEKPKGGGSDSFQHLVDFTAFVRDQNAMQSTRNLAAITLAETSWDKLLDIDGFLANMAIEFFLGFCDGYTQNTNNFYLYFDPYYARYVFIPWDFDYTFGSGPFDMEALLVGDYEQFGRMSDLPLSSAILSIPKYRKRFEEILDIMAVKIMDPAVSFPVVDSVYELIKEDVEWDHSLARVRSGPSWIGGALQSFIEGKVDESSIFPYCTSVGGAADFLMRVNSRIDFHNAVHDAPDHASLLGIKEFFERKVANFYKKSHYKPQFLESALHGQK